MAAKQRDLLKTCKQCGIPALFNRRVLFLCSYCKQAFPVCVDCLEQLRVTPCECKSCQAIERIRA